VPTGSPGDSEATLRTHVPTEIAESCTSSVAIAPALASVVCTARDNTIVVTYVLYPDATTMSDAYEIDRQIFAGDEAGSETCENADNWPSEYEYTIADEPSGRVLCVEFGTTPEMYWTDTRFNILSWALSAGSGSPKDMYEFWQAESGPY